MRGHSKRNVARIIWWGGPSREGFLEAVEQELSLQKARMGD